jgi:hypothetical protein
MMQSSEEICLARTMMRAQIVARMKRSEIRGSLCQIDPHFAALHAGYKEHHRTDGSVFESH